MLPLRTWADLPLPPCRDLGIEDVRLGVALGSPVPLLLWFFSRACS